MKVFVTGATGALGPYAVRALVGAGHQVTALVRNPNKASLVTAVGATPVTVSLFDPDALAAVFEGHDAVANLASALPSTLRFNSNRAWKQCHLVRSEGSRNIVDAAIRAGVTRVIQESVAMVYPDCGQAWIDESSAPGPYPAAAGNLAAEASAARFTSPARHGVVLRFGWFYGHGADHSELLLSLARHHITPLFGRPDGYVSSIHLNDAGTAVAAALDLPPGIYNVVDDTPLTKREFADALADAANTTSWIRGPGRLALLRPSMPSTGLTRSLRVSNHRLRDSSPWTPKFPSARPGLIDMAAGNRPD
jgi:nucleoside-diphosphate-sugar epimerase